MSQLNIGDTIHLNLQLSNGNTGKYVRATVRNASGVEISGSPVALTHIGGGLYSNDSLTMPNTDEVTAQYVVYDDAGFTTVNTNYSQVMDTFQKNPSGSGGSGAACAEGLVITGQVFDNNVTGVVPEDPLVAC